MKKLFGFRPSLVLIVGIVCASSYGQSVKLTLPPGDYQVWSSPSKFANSIPDAPTKISGPTASFQASGPYVAVENVQSGDLAVLALSKDLKVGAADFNSAGSYILSITSQGKPLSEGKVSLNDGSQTQTVTLTSDSHGLATFHDVKFGNDSVKLEFTTLSGDSKATTSITRKETVASGGGLSPKPVEIGDSIKSSVDSKSESASGSNPVASEGVAPDTAPTKPPTMAQQVGKLVQVLFGFLIVGAVLYGLYYLVKKDPGALADRLRKMGAPIPADPNDPASQLAHAQAVIPSPVAPAPQQKIMLPDSDPVPLASSPGFAQATTPVQNFPSYGATFSETPRLIRENGEEWVIQEGQSEVGREPGLPVSLVDQSTLSRRHAEFKRQGSNISIIDLGSTNGTFVNGRKIDSEVTLSPGDKIQFGEVIFKIES